MVGEGAPGRGTDDVRAMGLRGGRGTAWVRGGDDKFCVMFCSTACSAAMSWVICSCLAASVAMFWAICSCLSAAAFRVVMLLGHLFMFGSELLNAVPHDGEIAPWNKLLRQLGGARYLMRSE